MLGFMLGFGLGPVFVSRSTDTTQPMTISIVRFENSEATGDRLDGYQGDPLLSKPHAVRTRGPTAG